MITALAFIPFAIPVLWLFVIRPYCIRNRKGYTPGANIGVTLWVDWQEARETAKTKGDKGMLMVCRIVFWLHLATAGIFLLAVAAAVFR